MLREDGWELTRIRGSHHQFTHNDKPGTVTVQHPRRTFPSAPFGASSDKLAGIGGTADAICNRDT